nr:hypothetical protein [Gimesia chilikensis]
MDSTKPSTVRAVLKHADSVLRNVVNWRVPLFNFGWERSVPWSPIDQGALYADSTIRKLS